MTRRRPQAWLHAKSAHALVWLTLLLVVSGASRLLVVCAGPHSEPRLELTHASGHCGCSHDAAPSVGDDDHAAAREPQDLTVDALDVDHSGCVDDDVQLAPWLRPRASADVEPPPAEPTAVGVDPRADDGSVPYGRAVGLSPPPWPRRIHPARNRVLLI